MTIVCNKRESLFRRGTRGTQFVGMPENHLELHLLEGVEHFLEGNILPSLGSINDGTDECDFLDVISVFLGQTTNKQFLTSSRVR